MRNSLLLAALALLCACEGPTVKISVVDPGHFHASLVQKYPLEGVDSTVRVYAPEGPGLDQYLAAIRAYGTSL